MCEEYEKVIKEIDNIWCNLHIADFFVLVEG